MIRYTSQKQQKIEEFSTPFEQKISSDNRWVKLSKIIPWDKLASIYNKAMTPGKGRPCIDSRRIIGAIIIKHKLNLSDEETVQQILENAYLQYFLGYTSYEDKPIFSPTLFVEIRKRLGEERFNEMHDCIIDIALQTKPKKKKKINKGNNKNNEKDNDKNNNKPINKKPGESNSEEQEEPEKKGKLLMDATVAEQRIKYPNDLELLSDARRICETIIDKLYPLTGLTVKPRTYRKVAHKEFLKVAKQKSKKGKVLRKAIGKQLSYIARDFKHIDKMLDMMDLQYFPLSYCYQKQLWKVKEIFRQQKEMYDERKNRCDNRIVSISQPHVRPIVRGKTGKKTEFGSKIGTSMIDGYAIPEHISWDAYNESSDLIMHVENYLKRFGFYPEVVIADNIYGTKKNRDYMKAKGIRFSGKPLGRPKKMTEENKEEIKEERRQRKQEYRERIPIEGKFGQGKNGYNLNIIKAKLQDTSESWINSIFFVMNLINMYAKKINSFFSYLIFARNDIISSCFS